MALWLVMRPTRLPRSAAGTLSTKTSSPGRTTLSAVADGLLRKTSRVRGRGQRRQQQEQSQRSSGKRHAYTIQPSARQAGK